jgi:hypothetical protein
MRILRRSLFVLLPALLAGYVAWQLIPCQPLRSIPVPTGTKLLEFSPSGNYAVTFERDDRQLTLWETKAGQEAFSIEIPIQIKSNESTNGVRAFYGFSTEDRLLAVTTGTADDPRLVIVELESGNTETQELRLPANPEKYRPRPAFSSDCRYLSYFSGDDAGKELAVLYDLTAKQELLRVPGAFDKLGMPTSDGKWFLVLGSHYEIWNINEKKRECELLRKALSPSAPKSNISSIDMAADGQALNALHFVERASPQHGVFFYHYDWTTGNSKKEWEYLFPASAVPCWNIGPSDPMQYLLIKTDDKAGNLVEDLLEIDSGRVIYRYSPPIEMLEDISYSYMGQKTNYGAGLTHSLGRTGEFAIDSQRQVIASKRLITDPVWWQRFGSILSRLGVKAPRWALNLQFHSAPTGKLLQTVPIHTPVPNPRETFDPVIAMHPQDALVAIIDVDGQSTRLQFWQAPPPKPWGWIIFCSLSGAALAFLLQWAWRKRRIIQLERGA